MPLYVLSVLVGIFYIFIFVICLINIIKPRYLWKVFQSWKATKEPSNAYFISVRIGGIIGLIIITLVMVGPTLMSLLDK